jgi:UDP-N-acetylglucosamine 4-epimerase
VAAYAQVQAALRAMPRRWLITGVAGFIGSNLLEALLGLDQEVVGLDNFDTGHAANLDAVRALVTPAQWARFRFLQGDIRRPADCARAVAGADYVLHQAALGSVPRSLAAPRRYHETNVGGFLNVLVASRDARVRRLVYASSSSAYGDHPGLPKVEPVLGQPLSPYAVTKCANELYAGVFARCYQLESVGLRYFNVFGPRQDPQGAYAAVIPAWYGALLGGAPVYINGDGQSSRDFCFVANVVQANLLAATSTAADAVNQVYNVGLGQRTALTALFGLIRERVAAQLPSARAAQVCYRAFRPGDVRHSQADISKIGALLGYVPTHGVAEGLDQTAAYYLGLGLGLGVPPQPYSSG